MGRREIFKAQLIEDVHIKLKKENRARSINKAQSEMLISQQERDIKREIRKGNKMVFDTYQEMSTFFGQENDDLEEVK